MTNQHCSCGNPTNDDCQTCHKPTCNACLAAFDGLCIACRLMATEAERDALAAELARLRTLEAAAIAYRHAYIEVEENEPEALQALFAMNADQRAKFEKWAADADRRDRRRAVGRVDAWEGWCACLAANAINQPADDERERLRDLLRRCLPHVEWYVNLRAEIEAALAKREEHA